MKSSTDHVVRTESVLETYGPRGILNQLCNYPYYQNQYSSSPVQKKDLCLLGGGTFGVRQNLIQRGTEHSSRDASPEVRRTEWEFNNGAERSSALRMRKTVLRTVYGYFTTRHFRLMRPGSLGCLNDETNTRSSGKASHRDAFDAGFTSHATLSTD